MTDKSMYKDMWVFIEHDGREISPVSLELLCEVRRLCDRSGDRLAAVLALGLPLLGLLRSPEGNLLASLQRGDWVLAGVDLSLLGLGLLCAWLGWRRRQASSKPVRRRLNVQEVA